MGGGGPRLKQPRLSRTHLEPGLASGHPLEAKRGRGRLSRLDLHQSQLCRTALGAAERMAGDCEPRLEKPLQLHGRPLPRRRSRLAQGLTGPSIAEILILKTAEGAIKNADVS